MYNQGQAPLDEESKYNPPQPFYGATPQGIPPKVAVKSAPAKKAKKAKKGTAGKVAAATIGAAAAGGVAYAMLNEEEEKVDEAAA